MRGLMASPLRDRHRRLNAGDRSAIALGLLFLGSWLALSLISEANATPLANADGYDVIMVIDQSGSMSGARLGCQEHPVANDEHDLRIAAAHYLVIKLQQGAEKSHAHGGPLDYRYCIVEFGNQARLATDWRRVTYSPNVVFPDPIDELRGLAASNLGYTDFEKALGLVVQQFQKINYGCDGPIKRHLVVFIVTDGQPYSQDPQFRGGQGFSMQRFWELFERRFRDELQQPSQQNGADLQVGVIAIDDHNQYWPVMGQRWGRLATKAMRVPFAAQASGQRRREQLISFLETHFFSSLMQPPSVQLKDRFTVPCFVRKLEVSLFPDATQPIPVLIKPDGQPLQPHEELPRKRGQQRSFEIIRVPEPKPGEWRLGTSGSVLGSLDLFFDRPELLAPRPGVPVPQQIPLTFEWNLMDSESGGHFDYTACGTFTAYTVLTATDGAVDSVALDILPEGRFRNDQFVFTPLPGDYRVKFVGRSQAQGQWTTIIEGAELPLECSPKTPVIGRIIDPQRLNLRFGTTTVRIRVALELASSGAPVAASDVAAGSAPFLETQVFSASGDTLSEPVALEPDPGGNPTELVAKAKLRRRFRPLKSLFGGMDYTIQVRLVDDRVSDDYFIYRVER